MFFIHGALPWEQYTTYLVCSLLLGWVLKKRYGIPAGLFGAFIIFSALRVFAAETSPFVGSDERWLITFNFASASALALGCLTILVAQSIRFEIWAGIFQVIALINAGTIFVQMYLGIHNYEYGLLLNSSMSGCFNAVALPLFFFSGWPKRWNLAYWRFWAVLLVLISILACGRHQPLAVLIVIGGALGVLRGYWKTTLVCSVFALGGGLAYKGMALFDTSGRTTVWRLSMDFWKAHMNHWLGAGLGTYYYLGPYITLKEMHEGYIWLHSDWLQMIFECGFIGLAFMVIFYGSLLWRVRQRNGLFASLIGVGVWGMANFPLHNPISALLVAVLVLRSFEHKKIASSE